PVGAEVSVDPLQKHRDNLERLYKEWDAAIADIDNDESEKLSAKLEAKIIRVEAYLVAQKKKIRRETRDWGKANEDKAFMLERVEQDSQAEILEEGDEIGVDESSVRFTTYSPPATSSSSSSSSRATRFSNLLSERLDTHGGTKSFMDPYDMSKYHVPGETILREQAKQALVMKQLKPIRDLPKLYTTKKPPVYVVLKFQDSFCRKMNNMVPNKALHKRYLVEAIDGPVKRHIEDKLASTGKDLGPLFEEILCRTLGANWKAEAATDLERNGTQRKDELIQDFGARLCLYFEALDIDKNSAEALRKLRTGAREVYQLIWEDKYGTIELARQRFDDVITHAFTKEGGRMFSMYRKATKEKETSTRMKCDNCGKLGHQKRNCYRPGGGKGGQAPWEKDSKPEEGNKKRLSEDEEEKKKKMREARKQGTCFVCFQKGHRASNCPKKGETAFIYEDSLGHEDDRLLSMMEDTIWMADEAPSPIVQPLEQSNFPMAPVEIGGRDVWATIDTCATCSLMSGDLWDQIEGVEAKCDRSVAGIGGGKLHLTRMKRTKARTMTKESTIN
ncbi:MAG: hypothetical protein GY782_09155, partial [Gammaproteobacteria bacterium]|nr:hypothetical protein [Gammaproteobacteria bacterium]